MYISIETLCKQMGAYRAFALTEAKFVTYVHIFGEITPAYIDISRVTHRSWTHSYLLIVSNWQCKLRTVRVIPVTPHSAVCFGCARSLCELL